MNSNSYDIGFALGQQWAVRDASAEQLHRVLALSDGKTWIADQAFPAEALTELVDPGRREFMRVGEIPSSSFVAGFIDGAQTVESQHRQQGFRN